MTHSLRVGGASALYHAVGDIEIVKRCGRWKSSAFHAYLWDSAEQAKGLAQKMADEEGLDLVLVVPKADPPVARIIESSKLQFEEDKKKKAQRKAQLANRREVKEVKLRPNTDVADYNVVVKRALKFLGKGDSVKLTVRFSGRDFDFKNRGFELVERFGADLEATGVQEGKASMSGNRLTALFKSTVE